MLSLLGETLEYSEYINGIRFVDKTSLNVGKKVIFRFEIWLNKDFPKDKVNDYVKSIGKQFGCEGATIKDIAST